MTLMIALVGGQSLPNLLPVRHYHPEAVLFIYTKTTKNVYEKLTAVLQQETAVYGLETDAYDILMIEQTLNKALDSDDLASHLLEFNLTGGTKAMSLAAYRVAERRQAPIIYLESENKQSYVYHYDWVHQQLVATTNELIPECLTLKDFFSLCFGPGQWKETIPQNNLGGRFEVAIANALRLPNYEVMASVKAMKEQIDIDVAVRFGNQFGILEAKLGDEGKSLKGIHQLNNAFRQLSTYTQTFYVITVPHSNSHDIIAEASKIKFIEMKQYNPDMETLSVADTEVLVSIVEQSLKG